MSTSDRAVIHSSTDADWRTPPELFKKLDDEFKFTLDAAADKQSRLCDVWYGPESPLMPDALVSCSWQAGARIFLNPPFSRTRLRKTGDRSYDIAVWARKCYNETLPPYDDDEPGPTSIVAVLPAAIQTRWWTRYVLGVFGGVCSGHAASEVRFIPHRVKFLRADGEPATGGAGVNSCIVIWKPNPGFVGGWGPAIRWWDYR